MFNHPSQIVDFRECAKKRRPRFLMGSRQRLRAPVLLHQYLRLNAPILRVIVAPAFHGSHDGPDLMDLDKRALTPYMNPAGAEASLRHQKETTEQKGGRK